MQKRGEETRENILMTASQLFAKSGYEATAVAEICQQTGISKGAFYHHFSSKQAIFLQLLEDWLSRIEKGFYIIQQQSRDVPNAIMKMADNIAHALVEADVQLSLFLEFWTQANRDPDIWSITIAPYHRFQKYFTELINKGISEESINPINPELGANTIISLALGLLLQRIFDPDLMDWENETTKSVSLLLEGMIRREN